MVIHLEDFDGEWVKLDGRIPQSSLRTDRFKDGRLFYVDKEFLDLQSRFTPEEMKDRDIRALLMIGYKSGDKIGFAPILPEELKKATTVIVCHADTFETTVSKLTPGEIMLFFARDKVDGEAFLVIAQEEISLSHFYSSDGVEVEKLINHFDRTFIGYRFFSPEISGIELHFYVRCLDYSEGVMKVLEELFDE